MAIPASRLTSLLFITLSLLCLPGYATTSNPPITDLSPLLRQADEKQLSKDPYWLSLVHYKKSPQGPFNVESEIISSDFFLSPIGRNNPQAELIATLQAFFRPPTNDTNEHPQCRFIARFHWLREKLDWDDLPPPDIQCEAFQAWSGIGRIKSLSLIFATGYLSSPASFYGHILLKLNPLDGTSQADLLNKSVNYGAIVPENEPALIYVYRGLFGGYEAGFSQELFFRLNHNYAEHELRDLWEYELNLSHEQIEKVLFHTWELMGKKFRYFFLDKNCAYYMASLIDLVTDNDISYENDIFAVPITLFNHLTHTSNLGQPIIKDIKYIPSRQSRFINGMNNLDTNLRSQLFQIVAENKPIERTLIALSDDNKISVIDTLIDYYEYLSVVDKDKSYAQQKRRELLIARTSLPTNSGKEHAPLLQRNLPPTKGPLPGMFQIGLEDNSLLGSGLLLDSRFSYYDLLSLEYGRPSNTQLTALEIRLSAHRDELFFRNLDIVNVLNLNASQTGLPGDGGLAWKIHAFIENQDIPCHFCGDTNLTGGIGKGTYLSFDAVLYAMADINLRVASRHNSVLTLEPYIGLLASLTPQWKTGLTVGYQYDTGGGRSSHRDIAWNNRIGTSRDWDIRINYRQREYTEFTTQFSRYW